MIKTCFTNIQFMHKLAIIATCILDLRDVKIWTIYILELMT